MKLYKFVFTALLIGCAFIVHAQSDTSESIRSFDVAAVVNQDSTVRITETITYDFGANERHGIFRDIPVKYDTTLGNQSISLKDIKVADEKGTPYEFTTSSTGKDEEIKIGDPDSTVTGEKTYVISYTAERALGYFSDHDEFYWNATGNEWQVPIGEASFTMTVPFVADAKNLQSSCYYGELGSAATCTPATVSMQKGTTVTFVAPSALEAGQGLTGAVGFPKGLVYEPSGAAKFWQVVRDNGILALPGLVLLVMFFLWRKYGKDPKGRGTIIAEYDAPDGLTPLEVSAIRYQGSRQKDISAEIIRLAVLGYVKIIRTEEKHRFSKSASYTLERTTPKRQATLSEAEEILLDKLFDGGTEVKLSDLNQKFYRNVPKIKKSTMNSVISKGYYANDPAKARGLYVGIGIVLVAIGIFAAFSAAWVIALALSGVIVICFGLVMSKLTEKGMEAKQGILGLREYLQIAEKDRINFHDAPEKSPELFEKLLPFAMVLGVEKAWAKEFEGIYTAPPAWYSDPYGGVFNPIFFANSVSAFGEAATRSLTAGPANSGAGGGGFSGGGGGGGGGGSW
ncbi:MAG TPA: DUF2207 domain-containing protein [Candidatus Paceibacterota bacterium]|nr:DUF2207 domain-containing protein [Candidatus Paceibacterota bacterium]